MKKQTVQTGCSTFDFTKCRLGMATYLCLHSVAYQIRAFKIWMLSTLSCFLSELARLYRKKGEPVSSGPIIEARATNPAHVFRRNVLAARLLSLHPSFCPERSDSRKARMGRGRRSLLAISIGISFLGQISNSPFCTLHSIFLCDHLGRADWRCQMGNPGVSCRSWCSVNQEESWGAK